MKTKKIVTLKQKICIITITILMLFNFIVPNYSQATGSITAGGVLVSPITFLLLKIGDGINYLLNYTLAGEKVSDIFSIGGDNNVYIENDDDAKTFLNKTENKVQDGKDPISVNVYTKDFLLDYGVPNIKISAEEIFSNKISMLDANYFNDSKDYAAEKDYAAQMGGKERSTVAALKDTVASWYKTLRMIAIVGLLSVLVYIGIQILISAAAADKAKYKNMLKDWLVALCLIFFLHYIMVFTMTIVTQITDMLSNNTDLSTPTSAKSINITVWDGEHGTQDKVAQKGDTDVKFATNLIGYVRLGGEDVDVVPKLTNTFMYLALTFYTAYFAVIYIKRLLTLTFLTLIAPLVALTYPIDKVKDGKAQAFDFWLKEYVINAMLPVIHYVLYTVLVKSATALTVSSPLYAICAMAFIVPSEKLVKQMFGINSQTAPSGSMTGAALAGSIGSKIIDKFGGKAALAGKKKDGIRTTSVPSASIKGSGISALGDGTEAPKQGANNGTMSNANIGGAANAGTTGLTDNENELTGYNPAVEDPYNNFDNGLENPNIGDKQDIASINNNQSSQQTQELSKKQQRRANWGTVWRGKTGIPKGRTGLEIGKRAGKKAIRLATVATAGSIGLAAGMVGGNIGDMIKGTTGGIAFGAIAGKGLANKAESSIKTAMRDRDTINYGQDEAELKEAARDFDMNYEARSHLQKQGLSGDEINDRMKEYTHYNRQGITDVKEMDKLHDIRKEMIDSGTSKENANAQITELAELSKNYQKSDFLDSSKTEHITTRMAGRFEDAGFNEGHAKAAASRTVKYLSKVKGANK